MAVFPGEALEVTQNAQEKALSRWSVLAAALLIAMIGLFSVGTRESQAERSVHSSNKTDGQQISRRDPIRAIVVLERRDAGANHWQNADAAAPPAAWSTAFSAFKLAKPATIAFVRSPTDFWPAPLPRAPPSPEAVI